jgi:hypothetical protein
VGDQVPVEQVVKTKFSRDKYMGPFQVLEIPGNGTLKLALDPMKTPSIFVESSPMWNLVTRPLHRRKSL